MPPPPPSGARSAEYPSRARVNAGAGPWCLGGLFMSTYVRNRIPSNIETGVTLFQAGTVSKWLYMYVEPTQPGQWDQASASPERPPTALLRSIASLMVWWRLCIEFGATDPRETPPFARFRPSPYPRPDVRTRVQTARHATTRDTWLTQSFTGNCVGWINFVTRISRDLTHLLRTTVSDYTQGEGYVKPSGKETLI